MLEAPGACAGPTIILGWAGARHVSLAHVAVDRRGPGRSLALDYQRWKDDTPDLGCIIGWQGCSYPAQAAGAVVVDAEQVSSAATPNLHAPGEPAAVGPADDSGFDRDRSRIG